MRSTASLRLLSLLLLPVFFALALHTSLVKSPTVDESVHLLRGRTLWQTGNVRLQFEHAPFSHWLIGSLLFTEPTLGDVVDLPDWETADRITLSQAWLWQAEPLPNLRRAFFLGRFPIICAGLLLGALLLRWARMLAGDRAALLAGTLFAFSPNLIAHFSLATTDATLTAVFPAAVFGLWLYIDPRSLVAGLRSPTARPTHESDAQPLHGTRNTEYGIRNTAYRLPFTAAPLLPGLLLGLALGTKLTALLLVPLLLLWLYIVWWQNGRLQHWWQPLRRWLELLLIAGLVIWALYGFEWRTLPGWPFPLPAATYVNSGLQLLTHVEGGHVAYLFGERSDTGWWYYFILAFLVKTPAVTLLFLAMVVFLTPRRLLAAGWFLVLPPLGLFALASYSRFDIGYRHILPVLPFVWLLVAGMTPLWRTRRILQLLVVLLLVRYAAGALWQHPHHLAYFNEFAGGSGNGYRFLGDSNLDWGQDLYLLADYAQRTPGPFYYSYFGSADPAAMGLTQPQLLDEAGMPQDFAPANPAPGRYAISAGHLQGLWLAEPDAFDWFRRQPPVMTLGYSIFIYDVPQPAPGEWVAFCLDPGPLLNETAVSKLLGDAPQRAVYFDCHQSWVFPGGGAPGWYVLPRQENWPLSLAFPEHLRPVYTHAPTAAAPSFEVYYWDGNLASWLQAQQGEVTSSGAAVVLPVPVGGLLQLEAYRQLENEWWTVWRVLASSGEPLTVAGHLVEERQPPAVADGLGFSVEQWQPDDLFVQIHAFPEEASGRFLETGLYNYATGERLADFLRLYPGER